MLLATRENTRSAGTFIKSLGHLLSNQHSTGLTGAIYPKGVPPSDSRAAIPSRGQVGPDVTEPWSLRAGRSTSSWGFSVARAAVDEPSGVGVVGRGQDDGALLTYGADLPAVNV